MGARARELIRDQGRGLVGALLLGTPLLFTMETWWLGWRLPVWNLLAFSLGGLIVIMVVLRIAGFRKDEREGPMDLLDWGRQLGELMLQSFLAAFGMLYLFGILDRTDPLITVARVGLVELVPLGLGAAVANTILSGSDSQEAQQAPFPKDVAVFALGALFFALPAAPTDEMERMAAHAGWWRLAAILVASLLVTYLALYELGFRGQKGRTAAGERVFYLGETFLVYLIGLAVSALLLAGYGHFDEQPVAVWVQMTIVLGFPAAMGGAAAQVVL